ncbi:phage terminase large subunit family protein [Trichlorobacter lovleyi]|uniref:terminase gpA endonuclease subunit n=1 Tax=Trichlorobacter lovleyi TaxID=313985 RepID=UPI00223F3FD9|nr:terminase gpA endonuclease subunit [Trichlorobacter lovleyi]QOX78743.1 phage terminase large subunit family protein [Trichlorobacter lovleyi]
MMPAVAEQPKEFIRFRPAEIKVFRKRKRLPGPEWFERNINVPIGSRKGLYRNSNNPAMWGILHWATLPWVRTLVLAKGIQVGGTLIFYGLMLREAQYTADTALIVMADERSVKKLSKKRLQPMIDQSPALASIKSSNPDDTSIYSISLSHGFTIDIGWSSSEMSVSSESYRVVLLDEISKYKVRGNIEDAKGRTTVHQDTFKLWIWSSPGIDTDDPENRDPLMVEAEACDVMLEFFAKCPDCGKEQVMIFDRFGWPGQVNLQGQTEADPKAIRRNRSAWYQCEHCPSRWNDYKRDKAVLASMKTGWKPTDGEEIERPQSVYFHFPAWLSPYVSLSEVVASWLEAQGDEEKLRKWNNRFAGVSYRVNSTHAPELEALADRAEVYPAEVPMNAGILTAGADVQINRIEIEVVAWGVGNESWGIENQVFYGDPRLPDVWAQLDTYLSKRWKHESGVEIGLSRTFVDSGYCSSHVYKFTAPRKPRNIYSVKGASSAEAPEVLGPTKQRIGSTKAEVFILGGNKLKTTMFGYFDIAQPGPGYCHLPDTYDKTWYEQMQAEHQVAQKTNGRPVQVWQKKKANLANEAIDKRQYALAALMSLRVDIKAQIAALKSAAEPKEPQKQTASGPPGGFVRGWRR